MDKLTNGLPVPCRGRANRETSISEEKSTSGPHGNAPEMAGVHSRRYMGTNLLTLDCIGTAAGMLIVSMVEGLSHGASTAAVWLRAATVPFVAGAAR